MGRRRTRNTFDIDPEDAYGDRDGNLVETVGMNVLMRSVRDPDTAIGSQVEINGRTGTLQMARAGGPGYYATLGRSKTTIHLHNSQGREAKKARVQTVLEMNTGRDDLIKFEKDDVTINLPESIAYDRSGPTKIGLVRTLREHLDSR